VSDRPSIVVAQCDDELVLVEIGVPGEDDAIAAVQPGGELEGRIRPLGLVPSFATRSLVDVDASGSTIVLLLDRRPPLLVSHDAGQTWHERGSGLPRGVAIAIGASPDQLVLGSEHRLHVSIDGGVFWRSLTVELPAIRDVAWG
jgi:hypothetical protein